MKLKLIFQCAVTPLVAAFTPYTPAAGWTYYLEAARAQVWPACAARFVASDGKGTQVTLASSVNPAAEFELMAANAGTFHVKLANGRYLSYASACDELQVDTWNAAGANQEFRLVANSSVAFERSIEAVGRASCADAKTVAFSAAACSSTALAMGAAGADSLFRMHAVRTSTTYA